MKWNQISKRELEILFESGTQVYMVDRKPTAAKIILNPSTTKIVASRRTLDSEAKRMLDLWLGSNPTRVILVNDSDIEAIITHESSK